MSSSDEISRLRQQSVLSAKWNITGQFAIQLLNVGGTIILSRWLPPSVIGVALMLALISNFAGIIMNHAIGSAVVQNLNLGDRDLSSVFWFNLFLAAGFYVILLLASPLISAYYREDVLIRYIPLFGFIFFFYAFGCVSQSLLMKKHMFRHIVTGNLAGTVLSFAVAIAMVWRGFGVESVLVQIVLNVIISSLYFFFAEAWKPVWHFSIDSLNKIRRFALHVSLNSGLEYFVFNLDNFLVARFFGNSGLGLYGRARQWVFLPVQNIAFSISRGFFPSFARLKHDENGLRNLYLFSFRFTFYLTTVALTYMIIAAEDLVFVFLGEPWLNIVPLFTWFSLTGIIGTVNGFNDSFITSQGETGILVRTGMFEKVLTVTALLSALPFGLQGLVIARLITAIAVVIPKTSALLKVAKLSYSHWLRTILPTILICGCVALVGFGSKPLTENLSPVVRLAYVSTAFLLLVPVLSIIFRETSFQHIAHVILNRGRSFTNKENGL